MDGRSAAKERRVAKDGRPGREGLRPRRPGGNGWRNSSWVALGRHRERPGAASIKDGQEKVAGVQEKRERSVRMGRRRWQFGIVLGTCEGQNFNISSQ